MKYPIQTAFIYIRKDDTTPFHNEVDKNWTNKIIEATKKFNFNCIVTCDYPQKNILRYTWHLQAHTNYETMVDNIYINGSLKDVFKESMRHSKMNKIAFSMNYRWLNRRNENNKYFKEWYTNKKMRPDSKFIEEDKTTLEDRMLALKRYTGLNDIIMVSSTYNYEHTSKYAYFLYLKKDANTEKEIDYVRTNAPKNYEFKKKFNEKNYINFKIGTNITTEFDFYDFSEINDGIFDNEFLNLKIPAYYNDE